MDNRRIFVLVLILALGVGGAATYFLRSKSQNSNTAQQAAPVVTNLTNLSPADFNTPLKTEYSQAAKLALEANPQYTLSAVIVGIGSDIQKDQTTIRYVFTAATDPNNNWTITFNENGGNSFIRAIIPTADYLGKVAPFDLKLWRVNHISALQIAEKNGGLDWREQNTLKSIELTLRTLGDNNKLVWLIHYIGDKNDFSISVQADTGTIFHE